jgi:hypothetical protein
MTNKLKPQKFSSGEWAWESRHGWQRVKYNMDYISTDHGSYTIDGKHFKEDLYPTLLSVENAALLGFYPPEEPRKARDYWLVRDLGWFKVYTDKRAISLESPTAKLIHVREVLEDE